MPGTRIILVRHGEARAGVDHVIGGDKGCRGLTELGRAQAGALRDRLIRTGELRPDVVYASTLPRAVETAEVIAAAFGPGTAVRRARDLCEQFPGICDGLPYEETLARYAPAEDGPDEPLSPGGESAREFDARVRTAVERLVREHHDQTVLAVSHGGFIGAACMYVVGAPGLAEVYPFRLAPANTSISIFSPFTGGPPWTLDRYNDVAHLTGVGG